MELEKLKNTLYEYASSIGARRVKVYGEKYDLLYDVDKTPVISVKAVIRSYGAVRKIPIGEGTPYSTFEEAEATVAPLLREQMVGYASNPKMIEKRRAYQRRYRRSRREQARAYQVSVDRRQ